MNGSQIHFGDQDLCTMLYDVLILTGMLMHSHDYRSAEPFTDKSVLVLGAGLSGLDIAMELANVNAKVFHYILSSVHLCHIIVPRHASTC